MIKDNIKRDIKKYSISGIDVEIADLKFLYIELVQNYYNSNLATSGQDLITQVLDNLRKYGNSAEMNKFGARFKYSKLCRN